MEHKKLFIFVIVVFIGNRVEGSASCDNALGLESGNVSDSNITASTWSIASGYSYQGYKARLNGKSAWCAHSNDTSSWIQVSFGGKYRITGIKIQGSIVELVWVKKYRLEYRSRGSRWTRYPKQLLGNSLGNYRVKGRKTKLTKAVIAHDLRVYPLETDGISFGNTELFSPCLRMEFYGCKYYVECPHPRTPSNASIESINVAHKGQARFSCHQGFTMIGPQVITCDKGRWDHAPPVCKERCPDPGVPTNAKRIGSTFLESNSVTFVCDKPGFDLIGPSVIRCHGGKWSAKNPMCKARCPPPGIPSNGILVKYNVRHHGVARYQCKKGFKLQGSSKAVCNDGKWSQPLPSCAANKCQAPNIPPNMVILWPRKPLYNLSERVRYACLPGYFASGSTVRTCRSGTKWSNIGGRCIPKRCGDPGSPRNGHKSGLVYSVHSTVSYKCDQGYVLHGAVVIQCLANQTWSHSKPECRAVDCGDLPVPLNGVKDITKTTHGGLATFKCTRRGYNLVGPKTRRCQSNGRWSGSQPRCSPISCRRPSAPAHGYFSLASNSHYYKSKVIFACHKGYVMRGDASSVCLDDGTWSSPVPRCKKYFKRCPVNWTKYNGNCYYFKHKTRKTRKWKNLKSSCIKRKADLLDLHDDQEWEFIKKHLKKSVSFYAIGMRKGNSGWQWNTGFPVPLWVTNGINTWSPCGVMKGWSGEFTAVPCRQRLIQAYICKK